MVLGNWTPILAEISLWSFNFIFHSDRGSFRSKVPYFVSYRMGFSYETISRYTWKEGLNGLY